MNTAACGCALIEYVLATVEPAAPKSDLKPCRSALPLALLVTVAFVAAVAPTLAWVEFSNGMENLNVATVLEMRRGGPWLIPTLQGEPRVLKPPLTAWVTALTVPESLVDRLNATDPPARDAAYRELAYRVRITPLLSIALTLLALFDIGRTVGGARFGARLGVVAVAIGASNYYLLRFCRGATTDVQLTLWVTVANAFLARALLVRATWPNALGAGIAIGLALMSKGPVGLVHSVLPAVTFVGWRAWATNRGSVDVEPLRWRVAPNLVATAVALVVACWFVYTALRDPSVIRTWLSETNPGGGDRLASSNYAMYAVLLPFMLPWTAFLIDGLIRIPIEAWRERRAGRLTDDSIRAMYAVLFLAVTCLVMTCFRDRKERYLLPIVPFACVIAARGFIAMRDREPHAIPIGAHWVTLAVMACIPLLATGTFAVQTHDGRPWFKPGFAIVACAAGLAIVAIGVLLYHRARYPGAALGAGVALMLLLQAVGIRGYGLSREGRSEMRPLAESILANHPQASLYHWRDDGQRKRAPVDLSIYTNRATTWIADPATLPRGAATQVCVTLARDVEPEPFARGGWVLFDRVKRDKDWYLAYVRPPQ